MITELIPRKSIGITIPGGTTRYTVDNDYSLVLFTTPLGRLVVHLPAGQWKALGMGIDLKQEEWKRVVEYYIYSGRISFEAYLNYLKPVAESMEDIICDPIESGLSLLASKQLNPSETLILVKQ